MTESGVALFAEELNFSNRNKAKITQEHASDLGRIHFPPQIKEIHSTCSSGFHSCAGSTLPEIRVGPARPYGRATVSASCAAWTARRLSRCARSRRAIQAPAGGAAAGAEFKAPAGPGMIRKPPGQVAASALAPRPRIGQEDPSPANAGLLVAAE